MKGLIRLLAGCKKQTDTTLTLFQPDIIIDPIQINSPVKACRFSDIQLLGHFLQEIRQLLIDQPRDSYSVVGLVWPRSED